MTPTVLMTVDAVGGIWRYAMDLGAALSGRGCRVIFAGLGPRPRDGQTVEACERGMLVWGHEPLDWTVRKSSDLKGVGPWLDDLVRIHRPDIVQVNIPSQAADLKTLKPIVAVCHSCLATWSRATDRGAPPRELGWQTRLVGQGLARASAIVAPTAAHAQATEAEYGIDGPRHVPNATQVEPRPVGGGIGAIAAGRWWDRGKNGAVLAEAARHCRTPVIFVGATESADGQRLDTGRARVLGPLPHKKTLEAIAGSAVFVSPSLYEPFGLAALEAARLGRPLVLSDIPTYREIWEGAAVFFDPADPRALAETIDRLADDESARKRLGSAAQTRSNDFTPERQATGMVEIYQSILEEMTAS